MKIPRGIDGGLKQIKKDSEATQIRGPIAEAMGRNSTKANRRNESEAAVVAEVVPRAGIEPARPGKGIPGF